MSFFMRSCFLGECAEIFLIDFPILGHHERGWKSNQATEAVRDVIIAGTRTVYFISGFRNLGLDIIVW